MMTKQTAMVFTPTLMELSTKATGKMIFNMGREKRSGLMVLNMKENIERVRSTAMDIMSGQMAVLMKESG